MSKITKAGHDWIKVGSQHFTGSAGDIKKVNGKWYYYSPAGLEWGPYDDKEYAFSEAGRVVKPKAKRG